MRSEFLLIPPERSLAAFIQPATGENDFVENRKFGKAFQMEQCQSE
jgi:hypothetical protein